MSTYNYIAFHSYESPYSYYHLNDTTSDPYDDELVRIYDQMLYRALSEIFRCRTSDQIRQLIRTHKKQHFNENSIFNLILKQEPELGKLLLKRSELPLLWIVVLSYYQDSAELLVRCGADVNELYGLDISSNILTKQSTLLHALLSMYPSSWNKRFFDLLIDHGASLEARDSKARTILYMALLEDRIKEVEVLLKKRIDVNAVREAGFTAVHDAAASGKVDELIPLLMRYGADIKARTSNGSNVLRYLPCAPGGEHADLARFLIEKGVSPRESKYVDNYHPIHVAAAHGKIELINLYLDHGANVNSQDTDFAEFPLYVAARQCENPEVLLTLLKRGANIDLVTSTGKTALIGIAECRSNKNKEEKMRILLSAGAVWFTETFSGLTVFDFLSLWGHLEKPCTRLLLKTVALKKAFLQPSVEFKSERLIEIFPVQWKYYQDCISEIDRIKPTKFIKNGIFFELLTKCQCQMAKLMRNREFERKFRLYDLSIFPLFAKDIFEAFESAEHYHRSTVLEQENLIKEAFNDTLPHMVVRIMAGYALNCESCELKKIVEASRNDSQKLIWEYAPSFKELSH